jgi:hypothetical protein
MKQRVTRCDLDNLEKGESKDVNWMLRELGLTEILFDPPPKRPRRNVSGDEMQGMV